MPATRIVSSVIRQLMGEYVSTRRGTSDVTDFRKRNGGKETIRTVLQVACMYNNVVPFLVNIDDFHREIRLYLSVSNANTYCLSSNIGSTVFREPEGL